jgi:ATP-dependent Clp protease ATP-binding subunit ClpC
VELIIPQATKDFLIEKGFDPQYGARPLRRTIQRMVEDPLAEGLLEGKFHPGDLVEGVVIDGELVLQVRNRIEQLPAPASPEAALSAGAESSGGEASQG